MSPDLIPGAVMAARGYIEKGNTRYATRILKKAWEVQPHPDLAAAFAEIAPNETPLERRKRFQAADPERIPTIPRPGCCWPSCEIAAEDFPGRATRAGRPERDRSRRRGP